jgi:hypothetical protein
MTIRCCDTARRLSLEVSRPDSEQHHYWVGRLLVDGEPVLWCIRGTALAAVLELEPYLERLSREPEERMGNRDKTTI